jgi:hypothetical protein
MPTRYKSELPENKPLFEKEESTGKLITEILSRYPQHKRLLYLQSKFENNEIFTQSDLADLKRFKSLLG